jgi:hypothetical protein
LINKSPSDFCEIVFQKLLLNGRTIPSEQVRKSFSQYFKIPKVDPTSFSILVKNEKKEPVIGADIFLIADNNTYLSQRTNENGGATFAVSTRRVFKLYFASLHCHAYLIRNVDPYNDLEILVQSSKNIGSMIFNGSGYIPGLKGRLNPILDTFKRTYLYAENVSINGGIYQPAPFEVNIPIYLEDCDGLILQVKILDIQGQVSLIEFLKPFIDD